MNRDAPGATPIILDVDTGIDDALALLAAAAVPTFRVLGVTCVAGNASLAQVTRNTRDVLDIAGLPDVPVAAGADRPLLAEPRPAAGVHGNNGVGDLDLAAYLDADAPRGRVDDRHAVELLRALLADADAPVTLVALAPLTNIALLLRMHPEVVAKISGIAVMGGSAGIGNVTAVAEFNTWHDPEAAHICLTAGVPVLLYGLDVFYGPLVTAADIAVLRADGRPPSRLAADLLNALAEPYLREARVQTGRHVSCLGDAGLVCALAAPYVLETQRLPVAVSLADPLTRGQTVVDRRWREAPPGTEGVDVALDIDGDTTVTTFVAALTSN